MSLPARWSQKIEASDPANEIMELQMGPSHPASHGTIKFNLKLDGERIADCDVEVGFLHRAFEKMCEQGTWTQCFPYTDRLNYASPCINNVGFAMAVEKLIGIEVPERAQYLRVIMSEVSRITDHLTCLGMAGHEVGASTISMLLIEGRELLYDLVEAVTGARLTVTWCRVGGVAQDLPADFKDRIEHAMRHIDGLLSDADKLLSRNRVFIDRMSGVGVIPQKDIISYGRDRSAAARDRRLLRRAQGQALPGLRPLQVRHSGRRARRQLRSLQHAFPRDRGVARRSSRKRWRSFPRARSWLAIRRSRCRPRSASTIPSRG